MNCQTLSSPETRSYCLQVTAENRSNEILEASVTELNFSGEIAQQLPLESKATSLALRLESDRFKKIFESEIQRGFEYLSQWPDSSTLHRLPHSPYRSYPFLDQIEKPPWGIFPLLFEDGNPSTHDDFLFRRSLDRIHLLETNLKRRGLQKGTVDFEKEMLRRLIQFIYTEKAKGGWGVSYSHARISHLPRSPLSTYRYGKADCYNFEVFLTLCRAAGLDAFPVQVFRNEEGEWIDHVEVAVRFRTANQSEEIVTVDFQNRKTVPRNRTNWGELTLLELLSLAYSNWASSLPNPSKLSTRRKQAALLEKALQYSRHYLILTNYAICLGKLREKGIKIDPEKIRALLEEARGKNPHYFIESKIGEEIEKGYLKPIGFELNSPPLENIKNSSHD